jgi:ATP-dependent DNA helicase PIF1
LIGGRTIHSCLGIGLAKKNARELADVVTRTKPHIVSRIRNLTLLILDEISLIDNDLFAKISEFLSILRKNSKPFGGIQLLLSGDFCQIKPVQGKYCFSSPEWERAQIKTIVLEKSIRHDKDDLFKMILNELRWGKCSKETKDILKRCKKTVFPDGIVPTQLYSVNVDVDEINTRQFDDLLNKGAQKHTYKIMHSPSFGSKAWSASLKIPEAVDLCVGAQVVLTWNVDQDAGVINGSRGVVTNITSQGPKVKFVNGSEVLVKRVQICEESNPESWVMFMPLKLAYALTIHKSQGMTLDAVIVDLGDNIFEYGQAYTALSRVRDLNSVKIVRLKSTAFKTHPDVVKFYQKS